MFVQKLANSQIQELRKMVKVVPNELRNMARIERQNLIKMDLETPGAASYISSHGGTANNNILKEVINALRTKNAETFYKIQNGQIQKPTMPQVVKADMIF